MDSFNFKSIGIFDSCYKSKNGTPRQASIAPESKGIIRMNKNFFDKPSLSLEGLDQFSHIWVLFYFHQNTNKKVRAKIKPPRLNGKSTGIFSTRSPHRPNPIGLSLCKLDKIDHNDIHVSGIDLVQGTPILDTKPFIHQYDHPNLCCESSIVNSLIHDLSLEDKLRKDSKESSDIDNDTSNCVIKNVAQNSIPDWIKPKGVVYDAQIDQISKSNIIDLNDKISNDRSNQQFEVIFTERSTKQLKLFHSKQSDEHNQEHLIKNLKDLKNFYLNYGKSKDVQDEKIENDEIIEDSEKNENEIDEISCNSNLVKCKYCYEFLDSSEEAKRAIVNILKSDPRSSYRRNKCTDRIYIFALDTMHIRAWFDEEDKIIEIIKIKPNYL